MTCWNYAYPNEGFYYPVKGNEDIVSIGSRTYVMSLSSAQRPEDIRTVEKYPYSYSPFIAVGNYLKQPDKGYRRSGDYSDRLQQWDRDKYNRSYDMAFDNQAQRLRPSQMSVKQASKFLSAYHGKEIQCYCILEMCNASNGYPLWYFCYWEKDD